MLKNLPGDRGREEVDAPPDRTRAFDLTYRGTVIGHLEATGGGWQFRYSDIQVAPAVRPARRFTKIGLGI